MEPGAIVGGRFQVERLIGSGGMGRVFRAFDRETERHIAIKCLYEANAEDTSRFVREAQILAGFEHPHVVRYVAHGIDGVGVPWLGMEWLEGEDLSDRIARGPLALGESIDLARRIASALGAAHARGIVHRDIKPSNVFLRGGRIEGVKLLDFGIAKTNATTRMTRTNAVLGTPGYIAPEQTRGMAIVDATADVFSLGALLFEVIIGEPAFKGDHVMAILTKILFEEAPRLRERRPDVPQWLDDLVFRMLSKNPEERPADGNAVVGALATIDTAWALADTHEIAPIHVHREALTDGERRACAIILIGPSRELETDRPSFESDEALRDVVSQYGGHFESLLDGSAAVVLRGQTVVTDLCAQAARCALAVRVHARGRPMVLAVEWAETTSKRPVSNAIEKAVQLLLRTNGEVGDKAMIAVDEIVTGLLDGRFDVRAVDGMSFLVGEHSVAEGARPLLGRPTPIVGRERDLRALDDAFTECVEEPISHAALVTAAPGIGKTRLAQEFWRRIRENYPEATLWFGRGDALRAGSPFGLLQDLVKHAVGLRDGDALDIRRAQLRSWVDSHVPNGRGRGLGEILGEVAGVPFPDSASETLREARRNQDTLAELIRAAWLSILGGVLETRPVIILLDDFHWGDWPSVQLLDRALRDFEDRPLFVMALARPSVHEVFPKLWAERRMQELRLRELPRKASEQLIREMLRESVEAETIDRIVRLSAGNAFYLEELIRATAERNARVLPETVVAMVQSRLDSLDEAARRLLRAASVFGEVFWTGAVAELIGGPELRPLVAEGLAKLVAQELVTRRAESRFRGEEEFAFRHALLREGAYSMLLEEDRSLGHRLAGVWLEMQGEQDPLVLAEHFELGGLRERAVESWQRVAERAAWAGDTTAALRYAQRGLSLSPSVDAKCALLGLLCHVHLFRNEWIQASAAADEVLRIAKPGSAPWTRGFLARLMSAQAGASAGEGTASLAALDLLLELEPEIDALRDMIISLTVLHFVTVALGRLDLAASCMAHMKLLTTSRDPSEAESARLIRKASLPLAMVSEGLHTWTLGKYEDAVSALRFALDSGVNLGPLDSFARFFLAEILTEQGSHDASREVALPLLSQGMRVRAEVVEGRGRWALANALRAAGEAGAAVEEARKAATLMHALVIDRAPALGALAAALLARGQVEEALSAAREAMALQGPYSQLAFRRPFVMLVHAECLYRTGERLAARNAIEEALTWLDSVAHTIPNPSERQSFLENVVENRKMRALSLEWAAPTV